MATSNTVTVELVIDARSAAAGAAAYDAAMKKAEAAASRVVAVNDNAQAAIERSTVTMTQSAGRQAAAWGRVAAAADPVVAATLALERATTAGNAAMAKGVATADQVASTLAVYRSRLDAAAASSHRGTAATALNSGQVQNLTFQLNDMATMLASGQSPFVMLMQQGMQMAQVFGPGVGVGGALKATGAALMSFLTNPLTLAVIGTAAAAGAVSLLWNAVSSSSSAERALEEHKALIEDIRDAYGEAGRAATSYATQSAQVLEFRTTSAVADNAAALNDALDKFARMYEPGFGDILVDFGALNPLVQEFTQSIRAGTADVAGFQREIAAVGNATDDIETDDAVRQVMALIDPLIVLEEQARQTAGATRLFAGTLVTLGKAGTLRFADAFGGLDGIKGDLSGFLDEQNRAAEEAARTAEQQQDAIDGVITQLRFEEEQLARTAREQAIYNSLKQAGVTIDSAAGREIAAAAGSLYDASQAQDALNKKLQEAKGYASGFFDTFLGGLQSGQGLVSSLSSAVGGLASKLGSDFLGSIGTNIGGGVGSFLGSILGPLGSAIGNVAGGFLGDLFDSIFGGNDAEREAEREQRRAERRLKAQERRDKIDAKREKLEQQEEQRLAKQEARARRMEGYADRATVAGLDTTTLSGQLTQFDLEAQREREQVLRDGGKKANKELAALDKALAAERLQIQRDFNDDMVAEAKSAQDELNRVGKSIVEYIAGLNSGADSPLSPSDRLAAAQSTYASQLALAQGGNIDAQGSITSYADDLISAAREMFASSTAFFDIFNQVKADLLGLPAVAESTDPVVQALAVAQAAITGSVDLMRTTLVNSLSAGFDSIDIDASGGISLAEMQLALGTTNTALTSIFNKLDTNGDGQLTKLELIRAQAALTATNTAGTAKDVTLGGLLTSAQLQSLGLSTDTKLGTLLTSAQLAALGLSKDASVASLLTKAQVQSLGLSTDTKLSTLLTSSQMSALGLASNATLGTLLTKAQLSALGLASNATLTTVATNTTGAAKDASLTSTTNGLPGLLAGLSKVEIKKLLDKGDLAGLNLDKLAKLANIDTNLNSTGSGGIAKVIAGLSTVQITKLLAKSDINGLNLDKLANIDTKNSTLAKDASLTSTTGNLGGIKANTTGGAKDVTLTDDTKAPKWAKNTALAAKGIGNITSAWLPVMAGRLFDIADRVKTEDTKGGRDADIFKGKSWTNPDAFKIPTAFASGGIIGAYAPGGIVGNGIWNTDSVRARYAGGGDIMLAGGEGVINARAMEMIGPSRFDLLNRGQIPSNDNGRHIAALGNVFVMQFEKSMRVQLSTMRALIETLQSENAALRAEVRKSGENTARAIERKPVAKPQTKVA